MDATADPTWIQATVASLHGLFYCCLKKLQPSPHQWSFTECLRGAFWKALLSNAIWQALCKTTHFFVTSLPQGLTTNATLDKENKNVIHGCPRQFGIMYRTETATLLQLQVREVAASDRLLTSATFCRNLLQRIPDSLSTCTNYIKLRILIPSTLLNK
jgi:hypothetical protein